MTMLLSVCEYWLDTTTINFSVIATISIVDQVQIVSLWTLLAINGKWSDKCHFRINPVVLIGFAVPWSISPSSFLFREMMSKSSTNDQIIRNWKYRATVTVSRLFRRMTSSVNTSHGGNPDVCFNFGREGELIGHPNSAFHRKFSDLRSHTFTPPPEMENSDLRWWDD